MSELNPSRLVEDLLAARAAHAQPQQPEVVRSLWTVEGYPRSAGYDAGWLYRYNMGPNVLWLTEALCQVMPLAPGMRVLDLGCGTALSSIFLAREFGVRVWAVDLWVSPSANWERIREAGEADRVFPVAAEAHRLPFAHDFFDAVVSVDAYHYFGTDERYLPYLVRFVAPGGQLGVVVPGNQIDPEEVPEGLPETFRPAADFFTFRSPSWWRTRWEHSGVVDVERADMIPDGNALWRRFTAFQQAWAGRDNVDVDDTELLDSPPGRTLGFTRLVARRS